MQAEPNDIKYTKTPYGDNLVARCDDCGRAIHLCVCDEEDDEDIDDADYEYVTKGEMYEFENGLYEQQDVDALGRNYSDADPGL